MNKKFIIFLVLLFSFALSNGMDTLIGTWKCYEGGKGKGRYVKVKEFENAKGFVFKDSGLMSITKSLGLYFVQKSEVASLRQGGATAEDVK